MNVFRTADKITEEMQSVPEMELASAMREAMERELGRELTLDERDFFYTLYLAAFNTACNRAIRIMENHHARRSIQNADGAGQRQLSERPDLAGPGALGESDVAGESQP
jgi:hypothetical protein